MAFFLISFYIIYMANIEQRTHQTTVQSQHQKISQKQIQGIAFLSMTNEEINHEIANFVQENPFIKIQNHKKNKNFASSNAFQAIIENQETYSESLQAHLLHQINSMPLTEAELEISQRLIYNLDQNGCYASMLAPESLLDFDNPNHTKKLLNRCIKIIQRLDPVGTCCKTLEESLLVQAKIKKNAPALALFILDGNLNMLDPLNPSVILKKILTYKTNWHKQAFAPEILIDTIPLTEDSVIEAIDFIKKLNPRPAQGFSHDTSFSENLFSDIVLQIEKVPGSIPSDNFAKGLVSSNSNFHFQIRYSSKEIPDLTIDDSLLLGMNKNSEIYKNSKSYISQAQDFIDNLRFRESTLVLQGCGIVKYQLDFFKNGIDFLKPLTRAQIANFLGIHESTVSRISNKKNSKFIQTEWGIFPLSYFFTSGLSTTEKQPISSTVIKSKIQKYIEQSQEKSLSDSKLEKILNAEGIKISRRTIAKYRQQLGIENSYIRHSL